MPNIAEIKVINNEIWCKIPNVSTKDWLPKSSITVWTQSEIEEHDRQTFIDICRALYEAYKSGKI